MLPYNYPLCMVWQQRQQSNTGPGTAIATPIPYVIVLITTAYWIGVAIVAEGRNTVASVAARSIPAGLNWFHWQQRRKGLCCQVLLLLPPRRKARTGGNFQETNLRKINSMNLASTERAGNPRRTGQVTI